MMRKLLSVGLCSVGVLTLVGAGEVQAQEAEYLPNYTPAGYIPVDFLPKTGFVTNTTAGQVPVSNQIELNTSVISVAGTATVETTEEEELIEVDVILENVDPYLVVDGVPVSDSVQRKVVKGVTYVSLLEMAKEFDENAVCNWDANTRTATVSTDKLQLTAMGGQLYLVANGRYFYVSETLQTNAEGDGLIVSLSMLAKAFDAELFWNAETDVTSVVTGSGGILSGDQFYNPDDLFWMSRVVYAESGNQPLEGQMGVAMVVLNRVERPAYPNTILGVLAQQNQFSVYQNGALAYRTPTENSIIAAKLVMEGGEVEILKNATHFDSLTVSWASQNLTTIVKIGGHTFYG